ncbi:MAG TPA: hypothetical protein VGF69_08735, partial [Thermoanaerobaculia bacterium]
AYSDTTVLMNSPGGEPIGFLKFAITNLERNLRWSILSYSVVKEPAVDREDRRCSQSLLLYHSLLIALTVDARGPLTSSRDL